MTASDFKALATGNPYLKYKMELENDLTLLENQRRLSTQQGSLSSYNLLL